MTTLLQLLLTCGWFCQDIQVVPGAGGAPFKRDCGEGHHVVQFTHALGLWVQLHSHLLAIQYCCNGLCYVDDQTLRSLPGVGCWGIT